LNLTGTLFVSSKICKLLGEGNQLIIKGAVWSMEKPFGIQTHENSWLRKRITMLLWTCIEGLLQGRCYTLSTQCFGPGAARGVRLSTHSVRCQHY